MLRTLTLAIIEAMLRMLGAFPPVAGRALPRSATQHLHQFAQCSACGSICAAFEEPLPPPVRRRKPPWRPIFEVGWIDA